MGKFKRGILGGFQGKVGTVVGTRWRGINVMRAVPEQVRNPNTMKQRAQREKFRLVSGFMKKFRPVVEQGFELNGITGRTASNVAMSWNLKHAATGEYPAIVLDYPEIRLSMGTLEGVPNAQATADTAGEVAFSWDDNSGKANAAADDKLFLMIYNEDASEAVYELEAGIREAGTAILALPDGYAGDTLHAWIALCKPEEGSTSVSQYLGSLTAQ